MPSIPNTMRAFRLRHPGDTEGEITSVSMPKLKRGEALIRVTMAGICNTDLEIMKGYMGFEGILGHEFVGVVEEVGEALSSIVDINKIKEQWLGKRVVGEINVCCAQELNNQQNNQANNLNNSNDLKDSNATTNDANADPPICTICIDAPKSIWHTQRARNHCATRSVLGILQKDGTFAQYLTLPLANLELVPDELDDNIAVFCEPLAAAVRVVEQGLVRGGVNVKGGTAGGSLGSWSKGLRNGLGENDNNGETEATTVAIMGDGKLGLMIAEVCGRVCGRENVTLFGKHKSKMDFVKNVVQCKSAEEIGVSCGKSSSAGFDESGTTTAEGEGTENNNSNNSTNPTAATDTIIVPPKNLYPHHFDVVIEASGSPSGLAIAASICKPLGTLVLKSTCAGSEPFQAAPFVIDELRIVGSRCGPFGPALDFMMKYFVQTSEDDGAHFDPRKYITKVFDLEDCQEAIRVAGAKGTMKVQLEM